MMTLTRGYGQINLYLVAWVCMTAKQSRRRSDAATVPAGYDPDAFPRFAVTVDAVVFTIVDGRLSILLIRRGAEPYAGGWALPGGFKQPAESLDEAVVRELGEETGLAGLERSLVQLGAYGDPGRDPRMNVVTVAYVAAVPDIPAVAGATDAAAAEVVDVAEIAEGRRALAFDHDQIVADAVTVIRREVTSGDLAYGFLPGTFTLAQLRSVHEAVRGERLDPANFRRWATGRGDMEPLGRRRPAGPDGGKPAELYRVRRAEPG